MNEIIEYVREKRHGRNDKVGVLLGWSVNGNPILIGWSKVMTRQKGEAKDTFDKERGLEIARARKIGHGPNVQVPHIIRKRLPKFKDRCQRYFKGADLSLITQEIR